MARFDLDPNAEVAFTNLLLERMKLHSTGRVGAAVLSSVQFDRMQEHMTDEMVYRLQAEVLAERVLDADTDVAFSGSRTIGTGVRVRGLVLPFVLAGLLCFAGLLATSVALVAGSMAVALLAGLLLYLNPAEDVTLTVPVDGTVTVPATYWRKFPEANIVYPRELGGPVRFAVLHEPSYLPRGDPKP